MHLKVLDRIFRSICSDWDCVIEIEIEVESLKSTELSRGRRPKRTALARSSPAFDLPESSV